MTGRKLYRLEQNEYIHLVRIYASTSIPYPSPFQGSCTDMLSPGLVLAERMDALRRTQALVCLALHISDNILIAEYLKVWNLGLAFIFFSSSICSCAASSCSNSLRRRMRLAERSNSTALGMKIHDSNGWRTLGTLMRGWDRESQLDRVG